MPPYPFVIVMQNAGLLLWNILLTRQTFPRVTFLFPKLESVLKGAHDDDAETIKEATTVELKNIPDKAFVHSMQSWKTLIDMCIRFQCGHFQGLQGVKKVFGILQYCIFTA